MPNEIELKDVDFVTVGTIGPKGKRLFHLQAGNPTQLVSLILEKEQARALSEAIIELLSDLPQRYPDLPPEHEITLADFDMSLRDPVDALFRVAQMGLGFDEDRAMVVLIAQELLVREEDTELQFDEPRVVRLWASREQMRALSEHADYVVKQGRADPKSNGHLINY